MAYIRCFYLENKIQNNIFPDWAINNGKLSIKVLLYKDANISVMQELFRNKGYRIDAITLLSNSITITIKPTELSTITNMSSVWYIEPIDPPSEKENKTARTLGRSNTINTKYASGRHYNGEGINIMMQDDGIIGPHIDYQGRIDQSSFGGSANNLSNTHGDHVAGTIMGSGNLDPIAAGMANAAFLIGLAEGNKPYIDEQLSTLPFQTAEYNFYRAAQFSFNAQLIWPQKEGGYKQQAVLDIIDEQLSTAQYGLESIGINQYEIDRYLGVIKNRSAKRQNDADLKKAAAREKALAVKEYAKK